MYCEQLKTILTTILPVTPDSQTKIELLKAFSFVEEKECFTEIIKSNINSLDYNNPFYIASKAEIYLNLQMIKEAEREIERLISIVNNEGELDPWSRVKFIVCIARFLIDLGEIQEAEEQLEKALSIVHEVPDKSDRSDAMKHIAITYAIIDKPNVYLEIVDSIPFVQRKIEAIFEIMDILCEKKEINGSDRIIDYLPPEWKIVALSKVANCYFKQGLINKAKILTERILKSISIMENTDTLVEVYRNLLPIIISTRTLSEANEEINNFLGKIRDRDKIVKIIDVSSLKYISPIKLLGIEIFLLEHMDEIRSIPIKLEIQSLLLVIDILLDKNIEEVMKSFLKKLENVEEHLKGLYIQKFSNYIAVIFGKHRLRC